MKWSMNKRFSFDKILCVISCLQQSSHYTSYRKMIELFICIHTLVYSRLLLLTFSISWIGCRANSVISVLHTANASLLILARLIHAFRSDVLLLFLSTKSQMRQRKLHKFILIYEPMILTGENTNYRLLVHDDLFKIALSAFYCSRHVSRVPLIIE